MLKSNVINKNASLCIHMYKSVILCHEKLIYKQQKCVHMSNFMQNFGVALTYLSFKAYTTGCLQR